MVFHLIQHLYSYLHVTPASRNRNNKSAVVKRNGEDPKTLLELLQRAARLWPNHGIAFKDHGWDQKSNFMTYADLLKEVEVMRQECTTIVHDTD
jgi:hypothetical protein